MQGKNCDIKYPEPQHFPFQLTFFVRFEINWFWLSWKGQTIARADWRQRRLFLCQFSASIDFNEGTSWMMWCTYIYGFNWCELRERKIVSGGLKNPTFRDTHEAARGQLASSSLSFSKKRSSRRANELWQLKLEVLWGLQVVVWLMDFSLNRLRELCELTVARWRRCFLLVVFLMVKWMLMNFLKGRLNAVDLVIKKILKFKAKPKKKNSCRSKKTLKKITFVLINALSFFAFAPIVVDTTFYVNNRLKRRKWTNQKHRLSDIKSRRGRKVKSYKFALNLS